MVKVEQKILIEAGGQKLALSKDEARQLLDELKRVLGDGAAKVAIAKIAEEFERKRREDAKKIPSQPWEPLHTPLFPMPYYRDIRLADRTGVNPVDPYIVTSLAKQ